ncbi:helix-turn-helix transcriptional regulator [Nocardioides cavernaquae]|uniref:WYL domain-containing protein n=1 Tax=Nocardioides cavernaquae TaxID=2321396 RepID=A0A3A5HGM0_9ACTN|nr:WYL domain-containing protein [Nocardioides cavernaquae]RJS47214.1 WYL domain-containing protein [Nocardioides cavernaquae]
MSSGAKDQVGRLLALVPLIRRRGAMRVDEVADMLGVSPAQLVKDLKVLIFCGWPGWYPDDLIDVDLDALEPGGDGMIRISNADCLQEPLRLSTAEASALLVAVRALRDSADPAVLPSIDSTLEKLEGAVEGTPVASVQVPPRERELSAFRTKLAEAIRDARQVRLGYHVPARDEDTERTVDPIAVVSHQGVSYLDAWCHSAGERRSFRLDRVLGVSVLETAAEDHDLEPLDLGDGIFRPSEEQPLVTLQLAPRARWVAEYYPVVDARESAAGALEVDLRVADRAWLDRLLMRLTPHVTVLAPAEFTASYRQATSAARALYA